MLSVSNKPFMPRSYIRLNVTMLSVVVLSVVVPSGPLALKLLKL
jgi:hypothetical protein